MNDEEVCVDIGYNAKKSKKLEEIRKIIVFFFGKNTHILAKLIIKLREIKLLII